MTLAFLTSQKRDTPIAIAQPEAFTNSEESALVALTNELLFNVFSSLVPNDLFSISLSCRELSTHIKEDYLWKLLFNNRFLGVSVPENISYLEEYKHLHLIKSNIKHGIYTSHRIKGHRGAIELTVAEDNRVYSLSNSDGMIRVWDLETMTPLASLTQQIGRPLGTLCSLAVTKEKLFAGGYNGLLTVWETETMQCLGSYVGPPGQIKCMAYTESQLFTAHADQNRIGMWDLETMQCNGEYYLQNSESSIRSLTIADGMLIANLSMGVIEFWKLETMEHLGVLPTTLQRRVDVVAAANGKLFFGYDKGTIEMREAATLKLLDTITQGTDPITSLVVKEGLLISAGYSGCVQVWDVENPEKNFVTKETNKISLPTQKCSRVHLKFTANKLILSHPDDRDDPTLQVMNFSAYPKLVFQEIANLYKSENRYRCAEAEKRFTKMLTGAKEGVFIELNKLLGIGEGMNWVGDAFYNFGGKSSTGAQKAQAIENYLSY